MLSRTQFKTVEALTYPTVKLDDERAQTLSSKKTEASRYHDVMDQMYKEAQDEGLHRSIEEHGVHTPLIVNKKTMTLEDGHHRLAVAQRHLPPDTKLPVVFK